MRYRITVRGEDTELRGYIDGDESKLRKLSLLMEPFGLVVASPAEPDYNPFTNLLDLSTTNPSTRRRK